MAKVYVTPKLELFGSFEDLTRKSDGYKGKSTPGWDLANGFGADGVDSGCTGEAKPGSAAACQSLAIS